MREMMKKENEETRSSNGEDAEAEASWGTLEELLLACAVNRHGTASWDSIAKELQKRMKHSFAFSPQNCKQKYVHLKRRFHLSASAAAVGGGAGEEERENGTEEGVRDEEPLRMVDELRKLRVEELKREVQRHDLSIVSLQLKVKRLEERENSSPKAEEPAGGGSDLRIEPDRNANITGEKSDEPERSSPEKFDSAEDRSFNESNSSGHNKADNKSSSRASPEKKAKEERESIPKQRKPEVKAEPDAVRKVEPIKESGSGNVSASRPAELGESVSESKREQSSDVQSSASQSKKRRRRFRGLVGSGDELEAEEFSLSSANKRISVKSRPLVRFLEILRSHKHGSVFQRRLPSQETEKYRNMIRQHMDLDMVQSRLDKGIYNDCHPKFYRDLLLIFTNAVLFYNKSSAEHLAARELRRLVTHEIGGQTTENSDKIQPNLEANYSEPVMKKPRSSTTNMVVCRRRSSVSMQALSEPTKSKNEGKMENGRKEEKPMERKDEDEKQPVTRERLALRSGGLRLSNSNNRKIIISKEAANKREKMASDQKLKMNSNMKKQGVENFLKRMKQNSPSSQEKGDNDDSAEENQGEEEERARRDQKAKSNAYKKRGGNGNSKGVDVVVSRRNPSRRGEGEATSARRGSDRPPKRKAAIVGKTPESRKGGKAGADEKSKKRPRR